MAVDIFEAVKLRNLTNQEKVKHQQELWDVLNDIGEMPAEQKQAVDQQDKTAKIKASQRSQLEASVVEDSMSSFGGKMLGKKRSRELDDDEESL